MSRRRPRCSLIALLVAVTAAGALAWLWPEDEVDVQTVGENSKVTSRDGTAIAVTKLGQGPALILVDGAFCYRQNGPTPKLAPLLARYFTVYAYDRRDRAESATRPAAVASDTVTFVPVLDREVEDLGAVLTAAGGSAFVFGMSSGAGIVLRAAGTGMNIRKLALYEPPFLNNKDGQPRTFEKEMASLQRLVSSGDRSGAVVYYMTDVFGAPKPFVHAMRLFMRGTWRKNESVAHTLLYDLAILSDRSVLKAGSSIKVPTLVVGGGKSPPELQEAVKTVAHAIPRAQQRMLQGQTHNVSMSVLAPVLVEFFLGR